MSETTTENTTSEVSHTPAAKKGSKKLIIIVLAVVLIGGAGGFFYLRGSSASAETAQKAEKETKKANAKKEKETADETETGETNKSSKPSSAATLEDALPDDEDVKNIVELQPFIVNLADDDQARYLRMTVSVGIGGAAGAGEKPDTIFITRVRNAMLAVLSIKTSEDVLSVKGKTKLRKELLKAAQAASEEPEVVAIYITDFIVQL
jgi:flagellar FliL protein